ncbi:armadillo-type protein [Crassisporium funariophilum]|nr:armadillo-type protein [Crassisporium funariophilum]
MVAQTRKGGQSPKKRLTFHGQLAGKGVTTDALLKKLNALHTQLAMLDQETVDVNSLNTARTELIHVSLLLHKDRGVKAYTACCLADILRLYAPEAPYTQHELRDIFQFFFRQLSAGFKGTEEPYYNEYFHLLESLSTVKSVVLVCDLPSSDELLHEIFRDLFIIVKRDFTKKVEMFMADILAALIDECTSLPNDVLEVIMAQFMEKNARIEQPGYRLAVQLCNASADKLQRHVCQYFGDLLTSTEDGDEDLETIRTSHELVKRLHHSCPTILHSVIPILETELRADALNPRLVATQTLGEMYADKGGPDLVRKYPSTWQAWINRKADKAVAVRLKCVESTPALLSNLPEAREALEELLRLKILDPEDKVRAAACKVYSGLDYEAALHHVSEAQLRVVVARGLDKKRIVRTEALNSIAKLYSLAYPEIENNDPFAINHFAWIPDEILQFATVNGEIRTLVEQVVSEYLLPLPSIATSSATKEKEVDEVAYTDRLLLIMRHLNEKSIGVLIALTNLKSTRPNIYDGYLESCIQNNGGIIDKDEEIIERRLKGTIQHLSITFSDPVKVSEDLQAFAKLNDNRLYKLLKTCMDAQTDLKSLIKATNEFLRRIEQLSATIVPTMTIFLLRGCYRIVNQSCIPTLLKRVERAHGSSNSKAQAAATKAQILLTAVSKYAPGLFKSHIGELCKAIADEKKTKLVEVALQALANVARLDEKLATVDKKTNERIVRYATDSEWRQAKFAARYLAFSKNREGLCSQVIEVISKAMSDKAAALPVSHVAALVQLARFAPDAFEQRSDVIMTYLIKRILMVPSLIPPPKLKARTTDAEGQDEDDPSSEKEAAEDDEEWVEDGEVSDELRAKVLSLKVCRNRCLAHATSEQALEIAAPVLKLLATLVEHEGSLSVDAEEDPKVKSRMRLQAAISLLHLSTVKIYSDAIAPKFVRLACVVQDSCFNVRHGFLTKLITLLVPRKLSPRYNVIPFLTVLDPEADSKNTASSYINNLKSRMSPALRVEHLEMIFIRLLHLLAHHPDFATDKDEVLDMATYIQFYLDLVATSENISLLYHLSTKGKTVRDPESHSHSENFYIMCELAQTLIKARAQAHSWTLATYPGKIRLPADILRPLPSVEATNLILKTVFLPEEAKDWLAERFKTGSSKEKKEKKIPVKRKAPSTKTNGHAKRPRRKLDDADESDEESKSEAEDSDVEMADAGPSRANKHRKSDVSEADIKQSRASRLSARTLAKERLSIGDKKEESVSSDG